MEAQIISRPAGTARRASGTSFVYVAATFAALGGLAGVVLLVAAATLPPLRGHLHKRPTRPVSTWDVLTDANHLRAYAGL